MKEKFPVNLLYEMMRIRMVEERLCELYPEQEMRCPVHFCIGQEAIAVGVCANLLTTDYVLSGHRSHGHYLAKGGNLKAMVAEIYGKVTGCSKGKGGSMHLTDRDAGFLAATPIIGSTVPIAVGTALSTVMKGEPRVTVVFFGDGVMEEGVVCESLNFAALKKLPIVFVCENNGFSVYSPLSVRQPDKRPIYKIPEAHGVPSQQSDGNDIMKVLETSKKAIECARNGGGPQFLEYSTFRWREHCGPNFDDDLGYRDPSDSLYWMGRCPVKLFRESLIVQGMMAEDDSQTMAREISQEIEDAVRFAKDSPFPDETSLYDHVFSA